MTNDHVSYLVLHDALKTQGSGHQRCGEETAKLSRIHQCDFLLDQSVRARMTNHVAFSWNATSGVQVFLTNLSHIAKPRTQSVACLAHQ